MLCKRTIVEEAVYTYTYCREIKLSQSQLDQRCGYGWIESESGFGLDPANVYGVPSLFCITS